MNCQCCGVPASLGLTCNCCYEMCKCGKCERCCRCIEQHKRNQLPTSGGRITPQDIELLRKMKIKY